MNKYKETVSVVIPAYNVQDYICICLESVRRQTYTNFEVVIVNDGSIDMTAEKCNEFCERDNRFKLFTKENGGLSSARNYGLQKASGKYLTFIDSDDFIENDYILDLVQGLIKNPDCQISMIKVRDFYEDEILTVADRNNKITVVDNISAMRIMMLRKGYTHCAYGKMFYRELWKDVIFPEGRLYEDYLTMYGLFFYAKKVVLIDNIDYNYLQRETSIMHMAVSKKTLVLIQVCEEVTEWISDYCHELKDDAIELQMANYLKIYQRICNSNSQDYLNELQIIRDFVRKNAFRFLFYVKTPVRDKIKICLFLINKDFFLKLCNVKESIRDN